ncbi:MAG: methylated-DNA--[protein]-cysteine S-methyltransferase [Bryobacterales bacterium]|nr:methylated-DNA--[protein]-cysteine S-methyltransferase [Bryobacterales bacterium]
MFWCANLVTEAGVSLHIVADEGCVTRIEFGARRPEAGCVEDPNHPVVAEALRQLHAYFAGELHEFDLPLAPEGTPFQRRVWEALRAIPYGETRSYGDIAKAIGAPKASRAVGAANGRNPIPVVVPCHRVIGADGSLTGFGGGLAIKRTLLDLETPASR